MPVRHTPKLGPLIIPAFWMEDPFPPRIHTGITADNPPSRRIAQAPARIERHGIPGAGRDQPAIGDTPQPIAGINADMLPGDRPADAVGDLPAMVEADPVITSGDRPGIAHGSRLVLHQHAIARAPDIPTRRIRRRAARIQPYGIRPGDAPAALVNDTAAGPAIPMPSDTAAGSARSGAAAL